MRICWHVSYASCMRSSDLGRPPSRETDQCSMQKIMSKGMLLGTVRGSSSVGVDSDFSVDSPAGKATTLPTISALTTCFRCMMSAFSVEEAVWW